MTNEQEPLDRVEISGTDIGSAEAMYERAYNGEKFRMERTDREFQHRFTSVGDHQLSLRGNLFAGLVRGSIVTEGEYVVSWLTEGQGATDLRGEAVELQRGVPAVFVNDRPAEFVFRDFRQNLMHFDGAFLERVAADHEGHTGGPILFDTTATPTGEALRRWAATVSNVARVIHQDDAPPLLRSEAKRAAAISLLDTFPHETLTDVPEITIPASARIRRAVEYLHSNAHLQLDIATIAAAADVSERSLQAAFKRDLGLTPLDYLRRIRLDRVRDELRQSATGQITVADVARRWGFAHLGRFSARYAERFGEYPSATLAD